MKRLLPLLLALNLASGCSTSEPDSPSKTQSNTASNSPTDASSTNTLTGTGTSVHQDTKVKTVDLGFLGTPIGQLAFNDGSLVWVANRTNTPHDPDTVFLMDINQKRKKIIATSRYSSQPAVTDPQVSDRWITWIDQGVVNNRPENSIYAYNRNTGKTILISRFQLPGKSGLCWAFLKGNYLYWSHPATAHTTQIKVTSLPDKTSKTIASVTSDVIPAPYTDGKTVVWENSNMDKWSGKIVAFNLSNNKLTALTSVEGAFAWPDVYGNYVIYSPQSAEGNERDTIDVYNLSTRKTVSILAGDPFFWTVGDGYVTWSETQSDDVYIYFLNSQQQIDLGKGTLPYAFGNVIVWHAFDDSHVYVTTVDTGD